MALHALVFGTAQQQLHFEGNQALKIADDRVSRTARLAKLNKLMAWIEIFHDRGRLEQRSP
jgi:hypothetical protein